VLNTSSPETLTGAVNSLIGATYNVSKLMSVPHITIKDDILFNYFLERCNPLPILPVILGNQRYFIKGEIEDEEDEDEGEGENGSAVISSFHSSAFEEDINTPETLVSVCKNNTTKTNGNCIFVDPILEVEYPTSVFEKVSYVEKSKEDYEKIVNRLKPIPIQQATSLDTLNASIIAELGPLFDINDKPTIKVIDIIQENFGKHILLNDQLKSSIEAPKELPQIKAEIASVMASSTPPVPLLDRISDNIGNPLSNEYFKVISFLRSYIDLYHDIENYATEYCDIYYTNFVTTLTDASNRTFLDDQIAIIKASILTKTGNINQEKCREQIERIADLFIKYLHINKFNSNPLKKENARIMSASIDNPIELASLLKKIKEDGVEGFYIESANNNIGEILYKNAFKICNLTIGDWDAGSGFSGDKLKPKPTLIQIGPSNAGGKIIMDNMPIDMFGQFRVTVEPNNNTLDVSYLTTPPTPLIRVEPRQKLSVNKILLAAGKQTIRGTEDTKPVKLNFIGSQSPFVPSALITLKPWTDLVQIRTVSGGKVLTIIYDTLCETTARIYGLYHVLLCQGKVLTYYSYNTNSRNLEGDQVKQRVLLRYFIKIEAAWIKKYLITWFNQRINTLQVLINNAYDPILFFISKAFIDRYTVAATKSFELVDQIVADDNETLPNTIKALPDTLDKYIETVSSSSTLLADLLELYSKFKEASEGIEAVGTRGTEDIFLNAYEKTQRLIIATFKTGDDSDNPIILRAMVACTFAYYFIKKPQRFFSQFLSKLDDIKQTIIYKQYSATYTAPNIKALLGIKINHLKNTYNQTNLNKSLPKIAASANNAARNIADIQIAIQTLFTVPNYQNYIHQVSIGKIPTNPEYSFNKAIMLVASKIDSIIKTGVYFGGKPKRRLSKTHRRKTHKQKRTKRKTYRKRK
jgi:hypothetical protein